MADLTISILGPATFGRDLNASSKACIRCHERKVKCNVSDIPNGGPCRNCLKAGDICRRHRDRRTRSRFPATSQSNDGTSEARSSNSSSGPTPPQDSLFFQEYIPTTGAHQSPLGLSVSETPFNGNFTFNSTGIEIAESLRNDDTAMATDIDTHNSHFSGQNTQQGNQPASERFEVFVGDNFGELVPRFTQQDDRNGISRQSLNRSSEQSPGFEVDMGSRSTIDIERQFINLDSDDMDYLRAKGAFDLPPRHLQEDMVNAYFEHVNPVAPIINRTAFLQDFSKNHISSRLLLFAIFTAGCKVCQNPLLMDQYGTRLGTGHRFYKITKALLDTNYEPDKLVHVQALLLLTWWWDKKDDGGKNMRGCAVDAVNVAQSIGMSRWDQYPKDDTIKRGLWKRIWWGCVVRDANVATAHGLPPMLSLDTYDIHPLTAEDFIEEIGSQPYTRSFPYSPEEVSFSIEQAKVSEMLGVAHSAQYFMHRLHPMVTGSISKREAVINGYNPHFQLFYDRVPYSDETLDGISRACEQWYHNVPAEVQYDVDDIQGHRFWAAYLHIIFFTVLCTRYREVSVSKAVGAEALARKHWSQAQGIAAATMISKIIRNLKAHGQILRCTGFLTHALFNSLIYCLIEGQSPDVEVRHYAQQKYTLCLNTLYDFSQLWLSASLIHRLFEALQPTMNGLNAKGGPNSTQFFTEYFPNLHISSQIGNEAMKRLLASRPPGDTTFRSDDSIGSRTTSQPASILDTSYTSPSHFLDFDALPPEFFADNAEFPASLNPQHWCDFFDLEKL